MKENSSPPLVRSLLPPPSLGAQHIPSFFFILFLFSSFIISVNIPSRWRKEANGNILIRSSEFVSILLARLKLPMVYMALKLSKHFKSYCPYCTRVKQLFTKLGASFKAIELDVEGDGPDMQSALAQWTGQRTVPNVFINGKHIGGCDDTLALEKSGKLVPLLREAGAISGSASKDTMTA